MPMFKTLSDNTETTRVVTVLVADVESLTGRLSKKTFKPFRIDIKWTNGQFHYATVHGNQITKTGLVGKLKANLTWWGPAAKMMTPEPMPQWLSDKIKELEQQQ